MFAKRRIAGTALCCLALVAATAASAATGSVTLNWTAPGDDGLVGRAQAYALRYSTAPITAANFANATPVGGLPAPQPAGWLESFTVTGLTPNTGYYFAIETRDEAGHWSSLSNVAFVPANLVDVDDVSPELAFSTPRPNPARHSARFTWVLTDGAPVEVTAFDLAGRPVKTLATGWRPPGQGEVTWDLRDAAGRRVAAGAYTVRARLGARVWTRRLMVLP